MIKTVIITNYRGESLTLELANPYSSGFAVTGINGLGPSKATINDVEVTTNDGSVFNSAKVNPRNIVLNLEFVATDPDEVEALRQKTYKYFPLKKKLTFEVITDKRHVKIFGYTESNEPVIFSKNENTQISIICPYPFFQSVTERNRVMFYGEEPAFEFPFSNEGEEPVIEMGYVHMVTEANVNYTGDAEVGIIITIHAIGSAKNVSIFNLDTGESMKLKVNLVKGEDIIISTVKGEKYVHKLQEGVETNALNYIDRDADWFVLSKGDNLFAYTAEEGLRNLDFQIQNYILYEGV